MPKNGITLGHNLPLGHPSVTNPISSLEEEKSIDD